MNGANSSATAIPAAGAQDYTLLSGFGDEKHGQSIELIPRSSARISSIRLASIGSHIKNNKKKFSLVVLLIIGAGAGLIAFLIILRDESICRNRKYLATSSLLADKNNVNGTFTTDGFDGLISEGVVLEFSICATLQLALLRGAECYWQELVSNSTGELTSEAAEAQIVSCLPDGTYPRIPAAGLLHQLWISGSCAVSVASNTTFLFEGKLGSSSSFRQANTFFENIISNNGSAAGTWGDPLCTPKGGTLEVDVEVAPVVISSI